MKRQGRMQAHQLEKFASFLEDHPSFSPMLTGEDALVCGFQAGGSFLYIEADRHSTGVRRAGNGNPAARVTKGE